MNIYMEARGVSTEAQEGVAAVTMNRTRDKDHPSDVCKVVYEPGEFSWTNEHHKSKIDKKAFSKAKKIASLYLNGKVNKSIGKRLYFNEERLGKKRRTPHSPIVLDGLMMY
jgi:spore germination cell wall hydrolase CwlJ-like protein